MGLDRARIGLSSLLFLGVVGNASLGAAPWPERLVRQVPGIGEVVLEQVTHSGGRLDWFRGARTDPGAPAEREAAPPRVAFDAVVDAETRDTAVFLMHPDGSGRRCVTCEGPLSKGFVGQPAWHPDGQRLVVQVENEHSRHSRFEHPSWGFHNDLWVLDVDTGAAHRLLQTPPGGAALHPHFSPDGSRLLFAERRSTGEARGIFWLLGAPLRENPWLGWRVRRARFVEGPGGPELQNLETLLDAPGFYETHDFHGPESFLYSFTPAGTGTYVDDVFLYLPGEDPDRNLTRSPETWEEHGQYSPTGRWLTFVSSRSTPSWRAPGSRPDTIRLELWIRPRGGEAVALTDFEAHTEPGWRALVADYAWGPDGRSLLFQVARVRGRLGRTPRVSIWRARFPRPM